MRFSRVTLSLATVLVFFLVVGAGVFHRLADGGGHAAAGDDAIAEAVREAEAAGLEVPGAAGFDPRAPQLVSGAVAVRDTLRVTVAAQGEAEAFRKVEVTSRVSGTVDSVLVEDGDVVEAGQVLVRIDDTEHAMDLRAARAALTNARAEYEYRMLQVDHVDDPAVREERERHVRASAGLESARAEVERAERTLEWSRIRAPFGGAVADVEVVEGQHLPENTGVATLLQLDPLKVSARVMQTEMPHLGPGRRAAVTFIAFPGNPVEGRVRNVNPRVDPEAGTGRVTLEVPNPGGRIAPGMFARVTVQSHAFPDRLLVPREALLERDGRPMLFVAAGLDDERQGVAEWRYVTPGEEGGERVELVPDPGTDMVEPGEVVLVDGHHYLAHDVPVQLADDPRGAGVEAPAGGADVEGIGAEETTGEGDEPDRGSGAGDEAIR